jgi:hypothetical protein
MNREQFEKWKVRKEAERLREIEHTRDLAAAQGWAGSGALVARERDINEKYDADIEHEQVGMEAEEVELKKKNRERTVLIVVNIILAIAAITSIIFSTITYRKQENLAEFRPYIGIGNINVKPSNGEFKGYARIFNTGHVPANNVKIIIEQYINDELVKADKFDEGKSIIIMPEPTFITMPFSIDADLVTNKEWKINIIIDYDGVNTKKHSTTSTELYDDKNNVFISMGGFAR